jgi:hypothetical protein
MEIHVPQEGQDSAGELLRRTRPVLNPVCVCVCVDMATISFVEQGSSEELGKTHCLVLTRPCCCRGARVVQCAGAGDEGNSQRAAVLRPRGDRPPSGGLHVLHQHDDGGRAAAEEGGRRRVVRQSARRRLAHHARRLGACLRHLTSLHTTHPKRANNLDQVYILSKRLTEQTAFEFAREKGVHLVSLVIPTVAGPFLTPDVPTSVLATQSSNERCSQRP